MSDSSPSRTHPVVQYLAQRDVPCPGCGYNLRALPTPACPECGRALILDEVRIRRRLSGAVAGRLLCLVASTLLTPIIAGTLSFAALLVVFAGSIGAAVIEIRAAGHRARGTLLAAIAPTLTWSWIVLLLVIAALAYGIAITRMYR